MKKIIILSLLFIIEVALCNCSNQSIKTPSISIDFKATQGNYTGLNESLFKEEAIKVIGDSNLSIESCSKFLLTSKNYIILDEMQQKVWFINFNGEISHWIDYSNMDNNHKSEIFDLCIVGMDSLALFDIRLKKIVLYNEEGKFLEEHSVPFNYGNFESLTKDVYFFSLGRVNRKSPDIDYGQFCIYNVNDNKIINSFLPYSTCFKNWISYRKDLAKDNNRLVCITSFNNTIFALKNNSFAPLISLDFGDNNIDTTGLDNANRIEKMNFNRKDKNVIYSLGQIFLDSNFLYLWTILNKIGYLIEINVDDFSHKIVRGLNNKLFCQSTYYLLPKPQLIRNGTAYGIVFPEEAILNQGAMTNSNFISRKPNETLYDKSSKNPVIIKYKIRN